MKRTLIPSSRSDRFNVLFGIIFASIAVMALLDDAIIFALIEAVCAAALFTVAYVFQDQEDSSQVGEYSRMIEGVSKMGTTLTELRTFLEREIERVSETQRILEQLNQEKQQLEPVVRTQRQVVEAILSAHSKKTRLSKWKDWVIAFCLGVLASLLATYLFNLFPLAKQ
ncbi:hypothetical protein MUO65_00305 [bacterium]|nr:hypothetical protein [bacterium]